MIEYWKNLSLENLFYIDENGVVQEEEWCVLTITDCPYEISNLFRVKRLPRAVKNRQSTFFLKEKIITSWLAKSKYLTVRIKINGKNKSMLLHRVIALMFIPNPDNKPYINHKNGIKHDNRIENLEWCTSKENSDHAWIYGLRKSSKGENHGASKLTEKQVLEIRELKGKMTQKKIGELYGMGYQVIGNILRNEIWKHLLPS